MVVLELKPGPTRQPDSIGCVDRDQFGRRLDGQRAEHHLVHQREHGRVGADGQAERRDDRQREPGSSKQGTKRLANVAHLDSPP